MHFRGEIATAVAALPAGGGTVPFYSYDAAEHEDNLRTLCAAAFARRFVIVGLDGHHGRFVARLVPQTAAPVRCVAGMRHAGKARRRRQRRRADRLLAAYVYRDRRAREIGWDAAVRDPVFLGMLPRRKS